MARMPKIPHISVDMDAQAGLRAGLRAVQLISALVTMSVAAYVADWYNADTLTDSPAQVNWPLAAAVFSIFSVGYLEAAPRFFPRASHPAASLGVECANAVFHLSAFVYLSAFLAGLLFCRGSVCGAARAAAVFGAVSFLAWAASAGLAGRQMAVSRGTGGGFSMPSLGGGGRRRGQKQQVEKESRMEEGAAS